MLPFPWKAFAILLAVLLHGGMANASVTLPDLENWVRTHIGPRNEQLDPLAYAFLDVLDSQVFRDRNPLSPQATNAS